MRCSTRRTTFPVDNSVLQASVSRFPAVRTATSSSAGGSLLLSAITWRISTAVRFALSKLPSTFRLRSFVTRSSIISPVRDDVSDAMLCFEEERCCEEPR